MQPDLSRAQWRKSSYSGNSGNCVEMATVDAVVAVRDSKALRDAVLVVSVASWRAFICRVKHGKLDR